MSIALPDRQIIMFPNLWYKSGYVLKNGVNVLVEKVTLLRNDKSELTKANNLLLSMVNFGNTYTHDNSTEQFGRKHLLNEDFIFENLPLICDNMDNPFLQNLKKHVGFEFWNRLKSMFDIGYFGCFSRKSSLQLNEFVMEFTASGSAVIISVRQMGCNEIQQNASGKNYHFC